MADLQKELDEVCNELKEIAKIEPGDKLHINGDKATVHKKWALQGVVRTLFRGQKRKAVEQYLIYQFEKASKLHKVITDLKAFWWPQVLTNSSSRITPDDWVKCAAKYHEVYRLYEDLCGSIYGVTNLMTTYQADKLENKLESIRDKMLGLCKEMDPKLSTLYDLLISIKLDTSLDQSKVPVLKKFESLLPAESSSPHSPSEEDDKASAKKEEKKILEDDKTAQLMALVKTLEAGCADQKMREIHRKIISLLPTDQKSAPVSALAPGPAPAPVPSASSPVPAPVPATPPQISTPSSSSSSSSASSSSSSSSSASSSSSNASSSSSSSSYSGYNSAYSSFSSTIPSSQYSYYTRSSPR